MSATPTLSLLQALSGLPNKQPCDRFSREVLQLLSSAQAQGRVPSYRELADLQSQHHNVWLQALLLDWLEGGPLPTPGQLRQLCCMPGMPGAAAAAAAAQRAQRLQLGD